MMMMMMMMMIANFGFTQPPVAITQSATVAMVMHSAGSLVWEQFWWKFPVEWGTDCWIPARNFALIAFHLAMLYQIIKGIQVFFRHSVELTINYTWHVTVTLTKLQHSHKENVNSKLKEMSTQKRIEQADNSEVLIIIVNYELIKGFWKKPKQTEFCDIQIEHFCKGLKFILVERVHRRKI